MKTSASFSKIMEMQESYTIIITYPFCFSGVPNPIPYSLRSYLCRATLSRAASAERGVCVN
jgi:hypothetical protein